VQGSGKADDDLVVYTNKVRNLSMIVDNRLSFQDKANDIRRRVNFAMALC
jgi:hypothetical protein